MMSCAKVGAHDSIGSPPDIVMEGTTPESYISRTGSEPWNDDGAR